MNWNHLSELSQIEMIKEESKEKPVVIFKHSTRCSISAMALNRLERRWIESNIAFYFLDLIGYREISNAVERELGVVHQSPQAILLKDGKVVFDVSHSGIDFEEILAISKEVQAA